MLKTKKYIKLSCLVLISLLGLIFNSCQEESEMIPNFIVIVSDDTGWNDVGYHGSDIKTPNIDKLAQQGLELNHFYVSPTCSPTRAALLTGRSASRFGILGPIAGKSELALPESTVTLPSLLSMYGYQTAIIGKWHLGLRPEAGPKKYGFDYSYGYLHGQIDPYTHRYKFGDRTWHRNDIFIDEEGHATDLIIAEARSFIKVLRDKSKPFFLYIAFSVPHFPLQEPEKWLSLYPDIKNESRRLFAASMTHMDHAIGQLMETLREQNLEEDIILLYFSDNGGQKEWQAPKDQYGGRFKANDRLGDNRPLKGWKGDLYEGGIRAPALIYCPGYLKSKKVDQVISVQDILPTFISLVDIPLEEAMRLDGENVWPVLQGENTEFERILYWKTPRQYALRKGDWKLIHTGETLNVGQDEFFNIKEDPYEKENLIQQRPKKLSELKTELIKQTVKE